jgi:hypothetical protein
VKRVIFLLASFTMNKNQWSLDGPPFISCINSYPFDTPSKHCDSILYFQNVHSIGVSSWKCFNGKIKIIINLSKFCVVLWVLKALRWQEFVVAHEIFDTLHNLHINCTILMLKEKKCPNNTCTWYGPKCCDFSLLQNVGAIH